MISCNGRQVGSSPAPGEIDALSSFRRCRVSERKLDPTYNAIVIFEVLSRSNTKAGQAWRRRVYASVPNCRHYVTVSLKTAEITVYDRDVQWTGRTVKGREATADLPAIGVALPLTRIYRWTPLCQLP